MEVRRRLRAEADPVKAAFLPRFFKTAPGEYGEGDRFLGVTVPMLRRLARAHRDLALPEVETLIRSKWHEERFLGLLMLVERHRKADVQEQLRIARRYVALRRHVNNWDLVDSSAPYILGPHLDQLPKTLLPKLAASKSVWDRRIAIIATKYDVGRGRYGWFLSIAERVVHDPHDLIHKALGWVLRDVGDRDPNVSEAFLRKHRDLPRTALRYAIEHYPAARRRAWLAGRG